MARGATHDGPWCPTGGLSAGAGWGRRCALLGNNSGQHAAYLARTERTGRIFPRQALRLGLHARQSKLMMDGGDDSCPAFHLLRLLRRAHMRRRPQEILLVEAVPMLNAEAPRVQAAHLREWGRGRPPSHQNQVSRTSPFAPVAAGRVRQTAVIGTGRHSLRCRSPQQRTVTSCPRASGPVHWASGTPCVEGSEPLKRAPSLRGAPALPVGGGAGR